MIDENQIKKAIEQCQTIDQVEELGEFCSGISHEIYELLQDKVAEIMDYENEVLNDISWR